jgi:uncharacterized protein
VFDKNGKPTKPIMILVPGLSGQNDNLYTVSVWRKATKLGYNCCTVIFRGCAGLPLKTAKLSYPSNFKDMKDAVDYVYNKYIKDPKTGKKKQKLLAYGVSLGSMFLSNYLVRCGDKVPLDACVLYGIGWHPVEDLEYFNHNFFGLYNRGLIYPTKLVYKTTIMPQLKNLLD